MGLFFKLRSFSPFFFLRLPLNSIFSCLFPLPQLHLSVKSVCAPSSCQNRDPAFTLQTKAYSEGESRQPHKTCWKSFGNLSRWVWVCYFCFFCPWWKSLCITGPMQTLLSVVHCPICTQLQHVNSTSVPFKSCYKSGSFVLRQTNNDFQHWTHTLDNVQWKKKINFAWKSLLFNACTCEFPPPYL